jgi:hypothetical protein
MHFLVGAADTGFVSGPPKDRSSVIIAARQSANFIFASSANEKPRPCGWLVLGPGFEVQGDWTSPERGTED